MPACHIFLYSKIRGYSVRGFKRGLQMIKKKSRESNNKNAKERRKSEDRKVKGTIIKEWQSDEARKLRTGMSILRAASNNRVVMHAAYMSLVELKLIAQITRK